jgi:hypothetical protein
LTPLDHEQEMAAQESPRTTKLYYRKKERFTQDEVEWTNVNIPPSAKRVSKTRPPRGQFYFARPSEPDFGQLYVYRRKPTNASRKLWLGQDGAGLRKMRHRGVLKVDW